MEERQVLVWVASTDFAPDTDPRILDRWLTPDERSRRAKRVSPWDQASYGGAHALMRWALARVAGIGLSRQRIVRGESGRPVLAADEGAAAPSFNISHARGKVLVAIGPPGTALGVDVENHRRNDVDFMAIGKRFLDATELSWIDAAGEAARHERFVQVWTLKEALLKAVGCGLSTPMASFRLRMSPPAFDSGPPDLIPVGHWRLAQWKPDPDSWAALAVDEMPEAPLDVQRRDLDSDALLRLLAASATD